MKNFQEYVGNLGKLRDLFNFRVTIISDLMDAFSKASNRREGCQKNRDG